MRPAGPTGPAVSPARCVALCAALCAALGLAPAAATRAASPSPCRAAAETAAAETGVPLALLLAVAATESGRATHGTTAEPWPWAVNRAGRGRYPPDRPAAEALVAEALAAGESNIDIGCFQLNWHWHGQAFPSAAAMFDPLANARHAARFLSDLYAETGDWRAAAGAYHSRDPDRASAYVERLIAAHAARTAARPGVEATAPPPPAVRAPGVPGRARGPLLAGRGARGPLIGALP